MDSTSDTLYTEEEPTQSTGLKRSLSLTKTTKDRTEVINITTEDPSHLFWVPASQHPEIAPTEFQKYVETHGLALRKSTKRQSVLSMYVTANEEDHIEKTFEKQDKKRRVLSRSISYESLDYVKNTPDVLVFDRNSSPLDESRALVPKGDRPLLRRGARTNFKRNSSVSPYEKTPEPIEEATDGLKTLDLTEEIVMKRSVSTTVQESQRKSHWTWSFWSEGQKKEVEKKKSSEKNKGSGESMKEVEKKGSVESMKKVEKKGSVESMKKVEKKGSVESMKKVEKKGSVESIKEVEKKKSNERKSGSVEKKTEDELKPTEKKFTLSSFFSRKSQPTTAPPTVPVDFQLTPHLNRLPFHLERAIYRLSHTKLANPRRPLGQQVLISNHMFWYLSIVSAQEKRAMPALKKKKRRKPVQKPSPQTFISKTDKTGFVVPDHYLNPKRQKRRQQQQSSDSESDESSESSSSSEDESKEDDDIPLALYKPQKKK